MLDNLISGYWDKKLLEDMVLIGPNFKLWGKTHLQSNAKILRFDEIEENSHRE